MPVLCVSKLDVNNMGKDVSTLDAEEEGLVGGRDSKKRRGLGWRRIEATVRQGIS